MSLLLKALQNAAKNREATAAGAGAEPGATAADNRDSSADELSLEPVQPSARSRTVSTRPPAAATEESAERAPGASPQHAQAVLRAGTRPPPAPAARPGFFSWLASRPLVAFSTAAGVFAVIYGTYLYLQISNPGMFVAKRPPPPQAPAVVATAPAPIAPPPLAPQSAGQTPPPASAPLQPMPASAAAPPSAPGFAQTTAGSTAPAAPALQQPPRLPASPSPPAQPPASASVAAVTPASAPTMAASAPPAAAPKQAPQPFAVTRPDRSVARPDSVATAPLTGAVASARPRAAAKPPAAPAPPAEGIAASNASQVVAVDATVVSAYQALEKGRFDEAERMYRQALAADGRSVDAMLGLASTLTQQNKADAATQLYMRVLEQEPRNAYAQAGLLAIGGRADPAAAEARLKQLIAREPSAFLYFTLGNLYSEQGLWAAAQGAYFQAHNMAPDNPDYAFNLAVGLEHVSQPKLALEYYRRAATLAQARGHAQFDLSRVQTRIGSLESALMQQP